MKYGLYILGGAVISAGIFYELTGNKPAENISTYNEISKVSLGYHMQSQNITTRKEKMKTPDELYEDQRAYMETSRKTYAVNNGSVLSPTSNEKEVSPASESEIQLDDPLMPESLIELEKEDSTASESEIQTDDPLIPISLRELEQEASSSLKYEIQVDDPLIPEFLQELEQEASSMSGNTDDSSEPEEPADIMPE